MQSDSDRFKAWAELAEGDEARQFVQLVQVAQSIGTNPHRVIAAALDLKRSMGPEFSQHILWLNGVPWFTVVMAAALEAKIKAEVIAGLRAEAEAHGALEEAEGN